MSRAFAEAGVDVLGPELGADPVVFAATPIYLKDLHVAPPKPPPGSPGVREGLPPLISVFGPSRVYASSIAMYVDQGARAVDAEGSALVISTSTTLASAPPYAVGVYVVEYKATDMRGSRTSASRIVEIFDACEALNVGARVCLDTSMPYCSLPTGECVLSLGAEVPLFESALAELPKRADDVLSAASSTSLAAAAKAVLGKADTIPPLLAFASSPGKSSVDEMLVVGESWVATKDIRAIDDVDGLCGDGKACTILTSGAALVSTSQPTEQPLEVTYAAVDSAGNVACCLTKFVHVVSRCGSEPLCSNGKCGERGSCLTVGSFPIETLRTSTTQVSKASSLSLRLLGSSEVRLASGLGYRKCHAGRVPTPTHPCDMGVKAYDDVDGDITPFVRACGKLFAASGLAGCLLDANKAGSYHIQFEVSNSGGATATVSRILIVLGDRTSLDSPLLSMLSVPQPKPPTLQLVGSNAVVQLPRYSGYGKCTGAQNHVDRHCEPGVVARSAKGADLASEVLACAPEECLGQTCAEFRFVNPGMAACGIDTSAPVGTTFTIVFTVRDFGTDPPTYAEANRYVTIVDPCEKGMQYDPSTRLCTVSKTLASTQAPARTNAKRARIDLNLVGADHVTVAYNTPLDEGANSLLPCIATPAVEREASCGISARADVDGTSFDVSSAIAPSMPAQREADGSVVPQAAVELRCSLAAAGAGACFPGTYHFTYRVNDDAAAAIAGASAPVLPSALVKRTVRVVRVARLNGSYLISSLGAFGSIGFEPGIVDSFACDDGCAAGVTVRATVTEALVSAGYKLFTGGSLSGSIPSDDTVVIMSATGIANRTDQALVTFYVDVEAPPDTGDGIRRELGLTVASVSIPPAVDVKALEERYASEIASYIDAAQQATRDSLEKARAMSGARLASSLDASGRWQTGSVDRLVSDFLSSGAEIENLARDLREMAREYAGHERSSSTAARQYRPSFFRPVRAAFDLHRSTMRNNLQKTAARHGDVSSLRDLKLGEADAAPFVIGSTKAVSKPARREIVHGRGTLVGGILVATRRRNSICDGGSSSGGGGGPNEDYGKCTQSYSPYSDGSQTYNAIGQDPAYTLGSSLFDINYVDHPSYGAVAQSTIAAANETARLYDWNATRDGHKFPHAFLNGPSDRLPTPKSFAYPVYFPKELTRQRALALHTNLIDGGYIDNATSAVTVHFCVSFPRARVLAHVSLVAEHVLETGASQYRQFVDVFPDVFTFDGGKTRSSRSWVWAHVLELLMLLVVIVDVASTLHAATSLVLTRRVVELKYVSEARTAHARMVSRMRSLAYAPWNAYQPKNDGRSISPLSAPAASLRRFPWGLAVCAVCEVLTISLWYGYRFELSRYAVSEAGDGTFPGIYDSRVVNGTARSWMHAREPSVENVTEVWKGGYIDPDGSRRLEAFYAQLGRMRDTLSSHRMFAMLTLIVCLARAVCATSRHDSLGWYVRTMWRASGDLAHLLVVSAAALVIAHVALRAVTEMSGVHGAADDEHAGPLTVFDLFSLAFGHGGVHIQPHAWIDAASLSFATTISYVAGTMLWAVVGVGGAMCVGVLFLALVVHHARRPDAMRWWFDEDTWLAECSANFDGTGDTRHQAAPRQPTRRKIALFDAFSDVASWIAAWRARECGSSSIAPELRKDVALRAADALARAYHSTSSVALTRVLSTEEEAHLERSRWFRLGGGPECETDVRVLVEAYLQLELNNKHDNHEDEQAEIDNEYTGAAAAAAASTAAQLARALAIAPHTGGAGAWCEVPRGRRSISSPEGPESPTADVEFPDVSREGRVRATRTYRVLGRELAVDVRQGADKFADQATSTVSTMRHNVATMRRRLRRALRKARRSPTSAADEVDVRGVRLEEEKGAEEEEEEEEEESPIPALRDLHIFDDEDDIEDEYRKLDAGEAVRVYFPE